MGVFGGHHRAVAALLSDLFQPFGRGVLGHVHVRVPFPLGAFITDGAVHAFRFPFLNPQVGLVEIVAVPGFVSQRIDGDAGIVLAPFIHVGSPVYVGFEPFGVVAEGSAFAEVIIHAVGFDVGFVIDIKPVFVAEFIKPPSLRIVGKAHGVDVVLAHQFEVFAHEFFRHIMPGQGIVLVDVYPFQFYRLPVDEENRISLSVLFAGTHFKTPEAHVVRDDFEDLLSLADINQQGVEVRVFGIPACHVGKVGMECQCGLLACLDRCDFLFFGNDFSCFVLQFVSDRKHGIVVCRVLYVGF